MTPLILLGREHMLTNILKACFSFIPFIVWVPMAVVADQLLYRVIGAVGCVFAITYAGVLFHLRGWSEQDYPEETEDS